MRTNAITYKGIIWGCGLAALMAGCGPSVPTTATVQSEAALVTYAAFPSSHVDTRRVDVWLPPGYDSSGATRYGVLYMHDGQNLFADSLAGYGVEWQVDENISTLLAEGKIPPYLVVGIWNTPKRFLEYAPAKPFAFAPDSFLVRRQEEFRVDRVYSDEYLRFMVQELKPFVDSVYPTHPDRNHTYVMGSSMGGLISLYALMEYPEVFGGAGCLSTHWPLSLRENDGVYTRAMAAYLADKLPVQNRPRIYFDYGTATLDSLYETSQLVIDSVMHSKGYREVEWITRKFEGAAHNEGAWRQRVSIPLTFLLEEKR